MANTPTHPKYRLTVDVGMFAFPSPSPSSKEIDKINTVLTKHKLWVRYVRLKALHQRGHSQMTITRNELEASGDNHNARVGHIKWECT